MFITAAGFLTDHLVHKKLKKISTHLLTVTIISAIVQLEQRKGTNKEIEFVLKHPGSRVTGK